MCKLCKDRIGSDKCKLSILLIAFALSIILALIKLSLLSLSFWIILLIWLIIYILFFVKPYQIIASYYLWIVIAISFVFSVLISFNVISLSGGNTNGSSANYEKSSDGVRLSTCTSTINDQPKLLNGWKVTTYSAPLLKDSPNPDQANNVRTFSYSKIKSKSETNSLYTRIERADQNAYITGYGTAMELCDSNNKASYSYVTANTDYVAGESVVASIHYIHGGNYLHGPGNYRADVYVKTTDGVWHLIDRLTNIVITE